MTDVDLRQITEGFLCAAFMRISMADLMNDYDASENSHSSCRLESYREEKSHCIGDDAQRCNGMRRSNVYGKLQMHLSASWSGYRCAVCVYCLRSARSGIRFPQFSFKEWQKRK